MYLSDYFMYKRGHAYIYVVQLPGANGICYPHRDNDVFIALDMVSCERKERIWVHCNLWYMYSNKRNK